jgi:hypothetical protein
MRYHNTNEDVKEEQGITGSNTIMETVERNDSRMTKATRSERQNL